MNPILQELNKKQLKENVPPTLNPPGGKKE